MAMEFNLPPQEHSIIKVLGVGGGGGNAVESMFKTGIRGVEFVITNTDAQVLQASTVPHKIQLGGNLTKGLGCGADPEIGRKSAIESIEEVEAILRDDTQMVFITAGMGGGTGTGAAPVIAALAREMGILTVGIVTTPFRFEGPWRSKLARHGLEELRSSVDSLVVINNDHLLEMSRNKLRAKDAFLKADEILGNAARGISEIITQTGMINVDFADVKRVMENSGTALMGMAHAEGENRAEIAAEEALSSPLLENIDIQGARGLLVNVTASEDIMMDEMYAVMEYITEQTGMSEQTEIIFGQVENNELGESIQVTVIATGFDKADEQEEEQPEEEPQRMLRNPADKVTNRFNSRSGGNKGNTRRASNRSKGGLISVPEQRRQPSLFNDNEQPAPEPTPERDATPAPQNTYREAGQEPRRPEVPQPREQEQTAPEQSAAQNEDYAIPAFEERKPRKSSTQERIERIRQNPQDYDYRNSSRQRELEKEPAYLRRGFEIDVPEEEYHSTRISKFSVEDRRDRPFQLRENNSFLHDNVD